MNYFYCNLFILTEKSLEETAQIISSKIFGGVVFGGKDHFLRDEVPAIFTDAILGLRAILHGYGGEDGYMLEMHTRNFTWDKYPNKKRTDLEVDITEYVAWLLRDVNEIRIEID